MVIKNLNAGIFKIKIEVGNYFELDKSDLFIELREPTTQEALSLSKGSEDATIMFNMMPSLIIEHNFEATLNETTGTTKPMSNKEVWKLCMERSVCATEMVEQWSQNIPLANRKLEK